MTTASTMTSNAGAVAASAAAAVAAPAADAVSDAVLVIGLVSVSDRASGGVYQDQGIPALEDWLARALTTPYRMETRLIADERAQIEATLTELVDVVRCHLVLTTGGTGQSRRDVTPEATLAVATKEMPGFGEQMRQISLHFVPTAILSRQTAVIRETADHAALMLAGPGMLRWLGSWLAPVGRMASNTC